MRIRHALTGTALGAVLALGAIAAPAQAAQPQPAAQSVTTPTPASADAPVYAQSWRYAGSYSTWYRCDLAGVNGGLPYYCTRSGAAWLLYIWL